MLIQDIHNFTGKLLQVTKKYIQQRNTKHKIKYWINFLRHCTPCTIIAALVNASSTCIRNRANFRSDMRAYSGPRLNTGTYSGDLKIRLSRDVESARSKEASTSLSRELCNAKFSSLNSSQASSWACKSVSIVGSSVSIPIASQVARPWLSGPVWHLHKDAGAETRVQGLCLLHLDSCVHSLRSAHIASARTMIPCTTYSGKLAGGSNRWGVAIFSQNCHQDICFKVESLL